MNIIRTKAVELETIPALAYKQKLSAGGAGIKIHRLDNAATAVFTLDRRTGGATAYGKVDGALFPEAAIAEAIEATVGLPYATHARVVLKSAAAAVAAAEAEPAVDDAVLESEADKIDMVSSREYNAIIKEYADANGKLDYKRLNKEFIQFASKSKTVSELVSKGAGLDELIAFAVKNRAAYLAKAKDTVSDGEAAALIETLDEINPRSAFKELSAHLKRLLAKK
ncbi:MAG: hypothetical protein LBS99_01045 [Clostridiales bacterium]|jgi:hypothetical protein|nr:hypothetical protein [Clostridiales bacterium]